MGPVGIIAIFVLILAAVLGLLSWAIGLVATMAICFVLVCLLMMLVVLIQKPKGGGLSGAFGGGGGGAEAAFGAKTGDVLTWVTIGCFLGFLGLAMGLTWTIRPVDVIDEPALIAPEDAQTVPLQSAPQPAVPDSDLQAEDLLNALTPEEPAQTAAPEQTTKPTEQTTPTEDGESAESVDEPAQNTEAQPTE